VKISFYIKLTALLAGDMMISIIQHKYW